MRWFIAVPRWLGKRQISMRCIARIVYAQYAVRSFADALDDVPMALAENAGLSPITELSAVKSRQIAEGISTLGIDCNQVGSSISHPLV